MKMKKLCFFAAALMLALSAPTAAFAGRWMLDATGYWYENDNGSYPVSEWKWIDGDGDGIFKCYYFDGRGYLCTNTVIAGSMVDGDGAWVENGMVQTRRAGQEGRQLTKREQAQAVADSFAATYIHAGMTDFEKEMAILRFLIPRVVYDDYSLEMFGTSSANNDSFTSYGALVKGLAVCSGYAGAFRDLAVASGLEVMNVSGLGYDGMGTWGGHEWNLVRLDGEWYQVDVTFEDTCRGDLDGTNGFPNLFINMTDEQALRDHQWTQTTPPCTAGKFGQIVIQHYLDTGEVDTSLSEGKGTAEDRWKTYLMKTNNFEAMGFLENGIILSDGSNSFSASDSREKAASFLKEWFSDENSKCAYLIIDDWNTLDWVTEKWLRDHLGGSWIVGLGEVFYTQTECKYLYVARN